MTAVNRCPNDVDDIRNRSSSRRRKCSPQYPDPPVGLVSVMTQLQGQEDVLTKLYVQSDFCSIFEPEVCFFGPAN
jgi:hypothetical protein